MGGWQAGGQVPANRLRRSDGGGGVGAMLALGSAGVYRGEGPRPQRGVNGQSKEKGPHKRAHQLAEVPADDDAQPAPGGRDVLYFPQHRLQRVQELG